MALDHYVSQVHLKRFYASALGDKKVYAFRKSDGKSFICGSEDVCRLSDGNTNTYLTQPRMIEEFLKLIEPKYNAACAALAADEITPDSIFVLAGFTAFVMTCSPTAMRLGAESLRDKLTLSAKILDSAGQIPNAPDALDNKTITELLADGSVMISVDDKYPQAMGISNIVNFVTQFGNFHWDIIINQHVDAPFFTSDFPVAVEASRDPRIVNRVVPLTPSLAIRICPRIELSGRKLATTFEHFSYQHLRPPRSEILALNRTIVRSAENLVFNPLNADWVARFVDKHARFRVAIDTTNIPSGNGFLSIARTLVREQSP